MFEFLKIQYQLSKISIDNLRSLVGRRITQSEYAAIVGTDTTVQ